MKTTGKMKLYTGLLVPGLVLVGVGLWFLFNPAPVIEVPVGEPVIAMNITNPAGGTATQLAIYEDSTVICRENAGFRREAADPDNPATSIWRAGNLQMEELNSLFDLFNSSAFQEMDVYYQSVNSQGIDDGWGGTDCIISFAVQDSDKKVRAFGYLTPIGSNPPVELPYPLNEIHEKLMGIIEDRTEEVYQKIV